MLLVVGPKVRKGGAFVIFLVQKPPAVGKPWVFVGQMGPLFELLMSFQHLSVIRGAGQS